MSDLGTLVVPNADTALGAETLRPVASNLDIGFGDLPVRNEQPEAKDGLGQDIEYSIGDYLRINGSAAGAIGDTPDTARFK